MAKLMRCPNPGCTQMFVAEEIRTGTSLKCPRCGAKFKTRPPKNKPAAAPPSPPALSPGEEPPLAEPVPPAAPVSDAPDSPFVDEPFPDTIVLDRVQAPSPGPVVGKRRWNVRHLLIGLGGAAVIGVGIIYFNSSSSPSTEPNVPAKAPEAPPVNYSTFVGRLRSLQSSDEKVFQLSYPGKVWSANSVMKNALKVIHVMERSEPDAWLAVMAKDYGTQKPRDAELMREALDRLESYFGETLELSATPKPITVSGQAGQTIEFRGQVNAVVWRGECHMLTHHGVGYWIYVGAPSIQDAQAVFAEFQKDKAGFAMINERRGWNEQPPKRDTYAATKLPLTVQAQQGIWEKLDPTDEDENAEILLRGIYAKEKDNRKNARILVLSLSKQEDINAATKAARDYVEMAEQAVVKDYHLVPIEEEKKDEGSLSDVGNRRGRVQEYKLQLGVEPQRYILLAVINEPEGVIAIRCECAWESRQIWRPEFVELLATVRMKKGS